MEREFCRRRLLLKNASSAATLLAALLIGIVFYATAPAQTMPRDSGTKPTVSAPPSQQIAWGKDIFQEHCASCHFATTTAQKIGPGLKGMYARPFSDGKKVTDAGLTRWIEAGGKNMPSFKDTIKTEQIRELISYIKTL